MTSISLFYASILILNVHQSFKIHMYQLYHYYDYLKNTKYVYDNLSAYLDCSPSFFKFSMVSLQVASKASDSS